MHPQLIAVVIGWWFALVNGQHFMDSVAGAVRSRAQRDDDRILGEIDIISERDGMPRFICVFAVQWLPRHSPLFDDVARDWAAVSIRNPSA